MEADLHTWAMVEKRGAARGAEPPQKPVEVIRGTASSIEARFSTPAGR